MKKAGKFLSYLLVLTLLVSLFSGLQLKSEEAKAAEAEVPADVTDHDTYFYVLEIVPDKSMGTFGLLLGDRTILDLKKGDQANWGVGKVQTLVQKFGGTINTSTGVYSCSYFQTLLTNLGINKTVYLDTVKPGDLTDKYIDRADLIVINQTVPDGFEGYTAKTFDSTDEGCKFEKSDVLKIFKKIAGLRGDVVPYKPIPYMIDFSLYYSNGVSTGNGLESVEYDSSSKVSGSTTGPGFLRGVLGARSIDKATKGSDGGSQQIKLALNGIYQGSSRNSYKLLKLLSATDPATIYGLFFQETDGSYGFDEDLNQIFMYASEGGNITSFNLNMKSQSWLEEAIAPWYLRNVVGEEVSNANSFSEYNTTYRSILNDMGWFWAGDITYFTEGGSYYRKPLTKYKQEKGVDLKQRIGSGFSGSGSSKTQIGNGEIFYSESDGIFDSLTTDMSSIIASYYPTKSGTTTIPASRKVDTHPYRYLIVTDGGVSASLNRSVIVDMVKVANDHNIGLAGGIVVDCMSKDQFANISVNLSETYDGICVEKDSDGEDILVAGKGTSAYSTYSDKVGFSSTALVAEFTKDLLGDATHDGEINVNYITLPKEYKSAFSVEFATENGWGIYGDNDKKNADITKNTTYINSSNAKYRNLDFKFIVSGPSSSYDVYLYVDINNDDIFSDSEMVNASGQVGSGYSLGSVDNNKSFSKSVPLKDVLTNGNDFAGGFAWKLVISGDEGRSLSRIGFSALKPDSSDNTVIRILQIYPTDYYNNYTMTLEGQSDVTEDNTTTMSHPNLVLPTSSEVSITDNTILSKTTDDEIFKFLNGKIYVSVAKGTKTEGDYIAMDDVSQEKVEVVGYNKDDSDTFRDQIVLNSSMLYYYLKLLKNYDVDTTRYSVYQFNTKFGGKIDGSEETGEGQEIFYDATENKFYNYVDGKKAYFDLLMLGFGSSMDYMKDNAVSVIDHYVNTYGTALCGYGTVSRCKNNTLGAALKDDLAMTGGLTTGYNLGSEDPAEYSTLMITNDTILSHYPYTSNHYLKGAATGIGPYKLDLTNSKLVTTYAKFNSDSSAGVIANWGYVANNYYLYRVKNTTYCGFGKTRNKSTMDQLGGIMTPAEVQIVVNAIITAARLKQSAKADDPYINCIDPDRSVLVKREKEDKKEGDEEDPNNIWILWDSVYTDFDSLGMAKITGGSNLITGSTVANDGLISSGYNDGTYRNIPYDYRTAITGGSKLVFSFDEERTKLINEIKVDGNSLTNGTYTMKDKGTYYINVPLKSSTENFGFDLKTNSSDDQFEFYLTLLDKDDKVLELHKIIMVRRVLYPVN